MRAIYGDTYWDFRAKFSVVSCHFGCFILLEKMKWLGSDTHFNMKAPSVWHVAPVFNIRMRHSGIPSPNTQ